MNLRDLEYIEAVDRFRSFSKAAEACHVSQPALSNQIKKLELELGSELFDRRSNEVRTTELGTRIISTTRIVLQQTQKIRDMAMECRDPAALPLRIGMTPTLASYLILYLSEKISAVLPGMKVEMVEDNAECLSSLVSNRDIDIALLPHCCYKGGLDFTNLFDEPLFLCMRNDHYMANTCDVSLRDLPLGELILLEKPLGFDGEPELRRLASHTARTVDVEITTANLETVCRTVSNYGGVTVVPALAREQFKREGSNLVFVPVREADQSRKIGVISRLGCPRKQVLAEICNHVQSDLPAGATFVPDTENTLEVVASN